MDAKLEQHLPNGTKALIWYNTSEHVAQLRNSGTQQTSPASHSSCRCQLLPLASLQATIASNQTCKLRARHMRSSRMLLTHAHLTFLAAGAAPASLALRFLAPPSPRRPPFFASASSFSFSTSRISVSHLRASTRRFDDACVIFIVVLQIDDENEFDSHNMQNRPLVQVTILQQQSLCFLMRSQSSMHAHRRLSSWGVRLLKNQSKRKRHDLRISAFISSHAP